jgi:hypothetical protein
VAAPLPPPVPRLPRRSGAALERALLALEADPGGAAAAALAQDACAQLDASLEEAVTLLRRSEPSGAPAGELRGAAEAYSVLRGEILVQLRDAGLVVPGYGSACPSRGRRTPPRRRCVPPLRHSYWRRRRMTGSLSL